jgi:hypothetical protein
MFPWIRDHGDKALAGLLTLLTATNGYDPTLTPAWFTDQGSRWVAFCLAVAALGHTCLIKPRAGNAEPPLPPIPKQGGVIRLGQLSGLGWVAVLVVLALVGAADHRAPRSDCLPELITPAPSGDHASPPMVARP